MEQCQSLDWASTTDSRAKRAPIGRGRYARCSSNSGVLLATLVRLLSVQREAEDVSLRGAGLEVRPGLAATMASVAKHPRASVPSDESFVANSIARRSVLVRMTD
jgi:hypothetical protein